MIKVQNGQTLTTEVDISEVLKQISVCQPYFAFDRIQQSPDGALCAAIRPEQRMGVERGVMAAAEIGRHLAILGSCAAARANQAAGQHYYLAWKADLRQSAWMGRVSHGDAQRMAHELTGRARAEFQDKRTARAETELIHAPTGEKLYDLTVEYKVLSPKLFERMYAERRAPTPAVEFNPYAADLIGLGDVFVLDDLLSANLQTLDAETCAGHFPDFPALPVAILAHILISAAGKLYANIVGVEDAPYTVVRALVQAEHLAFTNDKLHLVIQHRDSDDDGRNRLFRCRALSEGKEKHPFGDLQITLRGTA